MRDAEGDEKVRDSPSLKNEEDVWPRFHVERRQVRCCVCRGMYSMALHR